MRRSAASSSVFSSSPPRAPSPNAMRESATAGRDGADSGGAAEGSAVVIEHDAVGPTPWSRPPSRRWSPVAAAGRCGGGHHPAEHLGSGHSHRGDGRWRGARLRRRSGRDVEELRVPSRARRHPADDPGHDPRPARGVLDAGELGLYSAGSIEYALMRLDYEEIMLTSQPQ